MKTKNENRSFSILQISGAIILAALILTCSILLKDSDKNQMVINVLIIGAALQIWRSKDNFHKQCEWSTWVYKISLNVCLTLLKKKKKNHQYFVSDSLPEEATEESYAFSDESLNQLYDAIKQLSEIDRGVILLYLEEKSYQEIADIIDTNPNNIGVRIKRIKERLKKLLYGKVN